MRSLVTDILLGAAAGAAATFLMDKATTVMYERESDDVRKQEDDARGDKTAYEIAGEKIGVPASAIHWGLGVGAGAFYGAARNLIPRAGLGSGLIYGFLFWALMDEAALTALGLTPPPQEFPWQTHARGLAGHMVFGAITESVFDVADLAA